MTKKIGFTMPHLQNNDSIAASKAWNKFKSGYMNRTHKFKGRKNERPLTAEENLAEYNREKHEFYYDTHKNKMSYIPTDDAERQDESFKSNLKKWQLPPMEVYNMTPNASESESLKVRNKFDKTYMKGNR